MCVCGNTTRYLHILEKEPWFGWKLKNFFHWLKHMFNFILVIFRRNLSLLEICLLFLGPDEALLKALHPALRALPEPYRQCELRLDACMPELYKRSWRPQNANVKGTGVQDILLNMQGRFWTGVQRQYVCVCVCGRGRGI